MTLQYDGSHSITFKRIDITPNVTKNSWNHFAMLATSRPFISIKPSSYQMINIPNSSNRIDLTDIIPNSRNYGMRSGSWGFMIDHNKWYDWTDAYYAICDFFNGHKFEVYLDDDPSKVYVGRITVSEFSSGKDYSGVTLQYNLAKKGS